MTKKTPAQCLDLSDVRVEIDRCDKALVDMIGERFGYVERAWQIKLGLNGLFYLFNGVWRARVGTYDKQVRIAIPRRIKRSYFIKL